MGLGWHQAETRNDEGKRVAVAYDRTWHNFSKEVARKGDDPNDTFSSFVLAHHIAHRIEGSPDTITNISEYVLGCRFVVNETRIESWALMGWIAERAGRGIWNLRCIAWLCLCSIKRWFAEIRIVYSRRKWDRWGSQRSGIWKLWIIG